MTGNPRLLRASARAIAPFAGVSLVSWLAVLVGPTPRWWEYWLSLAVVLIAGGGALLAMVDRRHPWIAVVPSALLLMAAIGLLRDSGGGLVSGIGTLAILPVFQTALYSQSRRDLTIVLVALALFYLVPIWIVGPPAYPVTQYRTVVLSVAADAVIGFTTQALVGRIKRQFHEARARERMLGQVAAAVHGLFDSPHPRRDVCEAVMAISEATSVVLYEPADGTDELVCVATAGLEIELEDLHVGRRSAAYDALRDREPVLVTENVEARVGLVEVWIAGGRPRSLLYQPLLHGETARGVLVIGWPDLVSTEEPRATVAALLAHEAAGVISRADALSDLSDEALTDALTGLPNRRDWDRQLRRARAGGQPLAIAVLDLDHFKQFNDAHGHPAGDRLLKETAAGWRDQLRTGDVLARIGGEEFGVLLHDCDAPTALEVVDRLRELVTHGCTCSAGIAIRTPRESIDALVERADTALYEAKAHGRDASRLSRV